MGVAEKIREGADTFEKKNADYGSSYRKSGQILFKMLGQIKLENEQDFIEFGLLVRKMDKLMRFGNLRFTATEQKVKDESIIDTMMDDGVYSFILADERERGLK